MGMTPILLTLMWVELLYFNETKCPNRVIQNSEAEGLVVRTRNLRTRNFLFPCSSLTCSAFDDVT